jgi:hypothetical protein
MSIAPDRLRLELSLKERANAVKAFVDGFGIGDGETHHGVGYLLVMELGVFVFNPRQDMIMRGHQAICGDLRYRRQVFFNFPKKINIIFRLKIDVLPVVTAIVDVIIKTRDKGGFSARHG